MEKRQEQKKFQEKVELLEFLLRKRKELKKEISSLKEEIDDLENQVIEEVEKGKKLPLTLQYKKRNQKRVSWMKVVNAFIKEKGFPNSVKVDAVKNPDKSTRSKIQDLFKDTKAFSEKVKKKIELNE